MIAIKSVKALLAGTAFRVALLKAFLAALLAATQCSIATADTTSHWQTTEESLAKEVLQQSNIVSDFSNLIDKHFVSDGKLDLANLKIVINNHNTPLVEPENTKIVLPYNYFTYAIKSHAELEETKQDALQRAKDTVEFTLYHLFGLLVAAEKSTDADADTDEVANEIANEVADEIAEALSSWLMIKGFTNGGEQWFKNAESFGRASQLLDGPLTDYWHEHALYKSRQRKINCWVLGSAPNKYKSLLNPVLDPETRIDRCTKAWQTLDASMQSLLKGNLRPDSSLLTH